MLHEEMWDTGASVDAELYQLWVNLPPRSKLVPPRVQLLLPSTAPAGGAAAQVQREGSTPVRTGRVLDEGATRDRTRPRHVRGMSTGRVIDEVSADGAVRVRGIARPPAEEEAAAAEAAAGEAGEAGEMGISRGMQAAGCRRAGAGGHRAGGAAQGRGAETDSPMRMPHVFLFHGSLCSLF